MCFVVFGSVLFSSLVNTDLNWFISMSAFPLLSFTSCPLLFSGDTKSIDTGTLPRDGYSCETLHDFMKSYDAGLQTDVAILDFSKAFGTVPHNKLLHKKSPVVA
jgi:hypothetical protein